MNNLINYISSLQYDFIFEKDKIIIPDHRYNALCDRFPSKEKNGWSDFKPVDNFVHRTTGVDTFVFDNDVDTLYVWNEKKQEYE